MGLDMYLFKRKKYRKDDNEYNKLVWANREEVMYWRKANQIRKWIVDHTDYDDNSNCEAFELTQENLIALRNDCQKVLDNHKLANKIMPSSNGFFFGNTEYDEWYFNKLESTVEKLNEIIETTDFNTDVIEYYEWW